MGRRGPQPLRPVIALPAKIPLRMHGRDGSAGRGAYASGPSPRALGLGSTCRPAGGGSGLGRVYPTPTCSGREPCRISRTSSPLWRCVRTAEPSWEGVASRTSSLRASWVRPSGSPVSKTRFRRSDRLLRRSTKRTKLWSRPTVAPTPVPTASPRSRGGRPCPTLHLSERG